MSCDLHRHSMWSSYDGSGQCLELAKIAKEKGYTSLGLTDHGTTSGLIQHYDACKKMNIKPILGCEGYFLPKYKEQTRGYHLILIAKNLEGFKNLNIIQSLGDKIKYYNPIWTFEFLEKYHTGLICSSACVASFSSKMLLNGKKDIAIKYLQKMKNIFKDDFYIEIQPYKVSDQGMQETVNIELIKIAQKLDIRCILTSDSHRGRKEDIAEYIMMHRLKKNDDEFLKHIRETYEERYIPDIGEMEERFIAMHKKDFRNASSLANEMEKTMEELEAKIDSDIIDKLAEKKSLPQFDVNQDSFSLLKQKVKEGLQKRKVFSNPEYVRRAKEELKVAKENEFTDYFLIVQDYVNWAKANNIGVGPGRGSGCNCLLNYLLGITEVDPVYFDLDFRRFIREGKTSLPDIDVDFEPSGRDKVQNYIIEKYQGKACQIASYGIYKVDNLVNDLAKLYDDLSKDTFMIKQIKSIIARYRDEESGLINTDELSKDKDAISLNKTYKRFFSTFCFLHNQVKYIGTHAAGIAISNDSIYNYTALRYDKKTGKVFSAYNLIDLERCGIVKYDLLGLSTLSSIFEIRNKLNKNDIDYKELINDKKTLEALNNGKTNGIFQLNEKSPQDILKAIDAKSFNDAVATTAMNRPGPLSLGTPQIYAESKNTWKEQKNKPIYKDIVDPTFGCILYQEQVMAIATRFGGLDWNEADLLRKMDEPTKPKSRMLIEKYKDDFVAKMTKSFKQFGMDKNETEALFESFTNYSFNKGHATGYTLISFEELYNKVHYPSLFWFTKLNQTTLEKNGYKFMSEASNDSGLLFFTPHVNYTADFALRRIEGEDVIQIGTSTIKGVGDKAAQFIESERKENGIFVSYDDFISRCKIKKSPVNKKVIEALINEGALNFNKNEYLKRVKQFNTTLFARAERHRNYE